MPKTILLLFAIWLSLYGLISEIIRRETEKVNFRDKILLACVYWGVLLVIIIEGLSVFHLLQKSFLIISWIFVLVLCVVGYIAFLWQRKKSFIGHYFKNKSPSLHQETKDFIHRLKEELKSLYLDSFQNFRPEKHFIETIAISMIVFQVITLAMVAYQYKPNNWDSMTYHLARIMHWQQNHTVADYATNIDRQVQMPPFAEYILLNLQILLEGDKYANFAQWVAMVISVIGVSNIAKKLGGNKYQQIIAGLLCAFVPVGILEATSTQNDYILAACLVILVSLLLSLLQNPKSKIILFAIGCSSGLSLLTKGTAYGFIIPIILVFSLLHFIKLIKHPKTAVYQGLIIIAITIFLNSGHYIRNFNLYRSPLGPSNMYKNELISLPVFFSNTIRNIALNVPIKTSIPAINNTSSDIMSWLRLLHQFTQLNPTDPRTTIGFVDIFSFFPNIAEAHDEDYSGNTIHLILIFMTIIAAFFVFRNAPKRAFSYLMIFSLVMAFILFSLVFKWQIWGSRLQLPLFILWCAVIPIFLFQSEKGYIKIIPILLALYLLNWTFANSTRPINLSAPYAVKDRSSLYFTKKPEIYQDYKDITNIIINSKCNNIGLAFQADTWEYPLWRMFGEEGFFPRIEHVLVNNETKVLEDKSFIPCAFLSDQQENNPYFGPFIPLQKNSLSLFLDRKFVGKPVDNPMGFNVSAKLMVILGQGWYDFEPNANIRWMKGTGNLWIYSDLPVDVILKYKSLAMNVNNSFGLRGTLDISLENKILERTEIEAERDYETNIHLNSGYNLISLYLEGGDFIPNSVDPNYSDKRSLGIAFYPLEIFPVDESH